MGGVSLHIHKDIGAQRVLLTLRDFTISPGTVVETTSIKFGWDGSSLLVGDRARGVIKFESEYGGRGGGGGGGGGGSDSGGAGLRPPHNSPLKAAPKSPGSRVFAGGRRGGAGRIKTVGEVYAEHRNLVAMAVHEGVIATAGDSGVVALHFEGCVYAFGLGADGSDGSSNETGNNVCGNGSDVDEEDDDGAGSTSSTISSTASVISSGSSFHPCVTTPQATKRLRVRLFGHKAPLTTAAFNTTGSLLVTGSEDGQARVWCVRSRRCISTFWVPYATIYGVQFGPAVQWKSVSDNSVTSHHITRSRALMGGGLLRASWPS